MAEQSGNSAFSPDATWLIRAGSKGEAEQQCFDEGICGIGWPDLPDLSGMGEEAINTEIDVVYGDHPDGRIRNFKMQIRHFLSFRQGNIVLMPLKTKPGMVAIGRVVGPYEYRPDLSNLTRHVRATSWLGNVRKDLLDPIKSSLDRPLTVSPTPATSAQIEAALTTGAALPLSTPANGKLSNLLSQVLAELQSKEDKEKLDETITKLLPQALTEMIGSDRPISHGVGIGRPADVPWVGIHPAEADPRGEEGIYAVYLFATDGSAAYLSVNQGTEQVRGGLNPLIKRARDIRSAARLDSPGEPMDLRKSQGRPARYRAASAYAIEYQSGAIPGDDALLDDLKEALSAVDLATARGLQFHPELEPQHLVFKWSADHESKTIELHRTIAKSKGSVWWGKFGTTRSPISKQRLESVKEQLGAAEVETAVFFYGGGELFTARLLDITVDPDEVDSDLMPSYYEKSDCSLFVRVEAFEELPLSWLAEQTVLASDPLLSGEEMSKALGNQTTPLFAYKLWSDDPGTISPTPVYTLDRAWLGSAIHWGKEEIDEILEALDQRGQVILCGPPGTGKTWLADHFARFLTDDQPLRYRTVQFHPSYGYEEFVEGLQPVADEKGAISFEPVKGTILEMAEDMENSDEIHVLVIDELNRANVPRVFGELFYLLEYRDKPVKLQFSPEFTLPKHLKVIATMNTADRSTRSIDAALRRRFEIFECPPRADILAAYYAEESNSSSVPDLVSGFAKLNADLTEKIDRHHTIGHSFFMRDIFTPTQLHRAWRRQIEPLIEDYFFDREDLAEKFKLEAYWPDA